MGSKKLPDDFSYLPEMYEDTYYPNFLVDKVKEAIKEAVLFIENGDNTTVGIQDAFDAMTIKINELAEEFDEHDSEIETVARESVGETVERIIQYLGVEITTEEAIRERDW